MEKDKRKFMDEGKSEDLKRNKIVGKDEKEGKEIEDKCF